MEQFVKKYIQEANEIISSLEQKTIELETNSGNLDLINEIFRSFHTLKGGGAMFGFTNISEVTHEIESIYDLIRSGKAKVNNALINKTLQIIDYLKILLSNKEVPKTTHLEIVQELKDYKEEFQKNGKFADNSKNSSLSNFENSLKNKTTDTVIKDKTVEKENKKIEPEKVEKKSNDASNSEISDDLSTYRIFFKPNEEIFKLGIDPLITIKDLTDLGSHKVFSINEFIPPLEKFDFEKSYMAWIIYQVAKDENQIRDAFIFVEDLAIIDIEKIADGDSFKNKNFTEDLSNRFNKDYDYFVEKYKLSNQLFNLQKLNYQQKTDEKDTVLNSVSQTNEDENILEDEINRLFEQNSKITNLTETIATSTGASLTTLRIASEKVDSLMNLVSELISIQARLNNFAEKTQNTELEGIVENINKISRQLRDTAFDMSMVPLQEIVVRFQRLVHDLSHQLSKDIDFRTSGTNTEIDKRMIENLVDPIMHIIRNCIDHGIETAQERKSAGKPQKGVVYMNAFYSGTYVYIQVGDDGRGINIEKIKQLAIAKNFLKQKPLYSTEEILNVIFEPGFSTSSKVSEISGRGVGLDVVKRKISEIRGEASVATTEGKGTVFTIKLPLTLSIIDGLMVEVQDEKFILPVNVIQKIYQINHEQLSQSFYNIIVLDGEQIPFAYLRKELYDSTEFNKIEHAIVIEIDDKKFAIIVDKVLGEYQAVLKPLGRLFTSIDIFSGATILGDGRIALVIDLQKITSKAEN